MAKSEDPKLPSTREVLSISEPCHVYDNKYVVVTSIANYFDSKQDAQIFYGKTMLVYGSRKEI